MRKFKESKGFTLIELMVVVAIIGILAAVAVPKFLAFLARSRKSEGRTTLTGVYNAMEGYFAEYEHYCGDGGALYATATQVLHCTGFTAGNIKIYTDDYSIGEQQATCPTDQPECSAAEAAAYLAAQLALTPPNGAVWGEATDSTATDSHGFHFGLCGNVDTDATFDGWYVTEAARNPCNFDDDVSGITGVAGDCQSGATGITAAPGTCS